MNDSIPPASPQDQSEIQTCLISIADIRLTLATSISRAVGYAVLFRTRWPEFFKQAKAELRAIGNIQPETQQTLLSRARRGLLPVLRFNSRLLRYDPCVVKEFIRRAKGGNG